MSSIAKLETLREKLFEREARDVTLERFTALRASRASRCFVSVVGRPLPRARRSLTLPPPPPYSTVTTETQHYYSHKT